MSNPEVGPGKQAARPTSLKPRKKKVIAETFRRGPDRTPGVKPFLKIDGEICQTKAAASRSGDRRFWKVWKAMLRKNTPEGKGLPKFDPDHPLKVAVYKASKCIRNVLERNPSLYPAD
jgi:hypothetical protein